MSDTKLGILLDETAVRDAIHVAVAPVIAAHRLNPGTHVGLLPDGRASADANPIGIIDPFLDGPVKRGQRCWLFLYQATVTGMKHHWQHPSFPEAPIAAPEALPQYAKSPSEVWMRKWAMTHMSYDYYGEGDGEKPRSEESAYAAAIEAGHRLHIGPYESARDYIDNEWWGHWETITGEKGQRGEGFSCSC